MNIEHRKIILATENGECGRLGGILYVNARDSFLFGLDMASQLERLRAELSKPFAIVEPMIGPG